MRSVPFEFVSGLAAEYGAVECAWCESERSFTGHVAKCWFAQLPSAFASKWAAVVGYQVRVRCVSAGPARFAVSVPVVVPEGSIRLAVGSGVGGCGWWFIRRLAASGVGASALFGEPVKLA